MSITITRSIVEQRKMDRNGEFEKIRIGYAVSNVNMENVDRAVQEVFRRAPDLWEDLPKHSAEILRSPGGGMLEVGVNYRYAASGSSRSSRHRKSAGDREWLVEINPRKVSRNTALSCVFAETVAPGASPVDPGLKINWNGKSGSASKSVEVDVFEADIILTCIAVVSRRKAESRDYIRQVASLVGKVNSENYHNWNAGELLFLGVIRNSSFIGKSGELLYDMTFKFDVRCNRSLQLGGITIPDVEGWDYPWILPDHTPGGSGVHSVFVSRIYERAPFAALDL